MSAGKSRLATLDGDPPRLTEAVTDVYVPDFCRMTPLLDARHLGG
jgi:hypothetical protein